MGLNTKNCKQSRNQFEASFFKLMSISCYGKTLESKRNCQTVQYVTTRDGVLRKTDIPFLRFQKVQQQLDQYFIAKTIFWNQPTKIGATILDLANFHVFKFYCNVMQKHFNCSVFFQELIRCCLKEMFRFLLGIGHKRRPAAESYLPGRSFPLQ